MSSAPNQTSPTPQPIDGSFLNAYRGRFVVFEGPDGSGKSTQFRRVRELCLASGVPVTQVREPGGTVAGERIREVLLSKASTGMSVRCEMLLFMASRAELVERVILPAMGKGDLVIADRFVASTLAYQGTAGGLPSSEISAVARVATRGLMPDLYMLYDVDHTVAAGRLPSTLDRMEAKGAAFHELVRKGYLEQAKSDPRRYAVVNAAVSEEEVWKATVETLRGRAGDLVKRS